MRKAIKRPVSQNSEEKLALLSGDQFQLDDELSVYTVDPGNAVRRLGRRRLSDYKFELMKDKIDLKTIRNVKSSHENAGSHSLSELCNFQFQSRG